MPAKTTMTRKMRLEAETNAKNANVIVVTRVLFRLCTENMRSWDVLDCGCGVDLGVARAYREMPRDRLFQRATRFLDRLRVVRGEPGDDAGAQEERKKKTDDDVCTEPFLSLDAETAREAFDMVVFNHQYHRCPTARAWTVLRPGGYLVILFPRTGISETWTDDMIAEGWTAPTSLFPPYGRFDAVDESGPFLMSVWKKNV